MRARDRVALRPFELDGRCADKQRPGKIGLGADAGLRNRFFGGLVGHPFGEIGRSRHRGRREIDRAGDRRLQAFGREARNLADAGLACGQLGPVVGLADAERGHDAHAGDDDDRTAGLIALRIHRMFPMSAKTCLSGQRSTSAMPSPRQWPVPTTTIWDGAAGISISAPVLVAGRKQLAVLDRKRGEREPERELRFDEMAKPRAVARTGMSLW